MAKRHQHKRPNVKRTKVDRALARLDKDILQFFPPADRIANSPETPWVSRRDDKAKKDRATAALDCLPAHSGIL